MIWSQKYFVSDAPCELIIAATRQTLLSINFAPTGIFTELLNLLKAVNYEGAKKLLSVCTVALSLSAANQMESIEQQKLAEHFLLIILDSLKCISYTDNSVALNDDGDWLITPDSATLGLESHFYLLQFYKCVISSTLFRRICMDISGLRHVIDNLLHHTISLVGNPQELTMASGDASYLCVPKRNILSLESRVEIFSVLLGLNCFFIYSGGMVGIKQFEAAVLPEIGTSLIKNLHLNKEDLTPVWKILLEAAIEPLNVSPYVVLPRTLNDLKEHSTAQLTSFVGQSSSENSGYDASSEDDLNQRGKQKALSNIPLILHPTLISFGFSVFDQYWENKTYRKPVRSLLSMFKFMIYLYNR